MHEAWQARAGADEDLPEARGLEVVERGGLADHEIAHEAPAEQRDLAHHVVDQVVRQAELRDTVAQYAAELVEGLELDAEAAKVLNAPKSDPAYVRYESSLFLAFDQAPQVEVPTRSESRLMQLRIYESHNTERALKKIEMFNTGGELAVFRECGMHPVFFGQALVGTKLPNLTYMLAFDDAEAQKAGWDKFRDHPDWKRLSGDPAYADTVTDITNLVLRPTPASQI